MHFRKKTMTCTQQPCQRLHDASNASINFYSRKRKQKTFKRKTKNILQLWLHQNVYRMIYSEDLSGKNVHYKNKNNSQGLADDNSIIQST